MNSLFAFSTKRLSLKQNFSWTLVGNVVYAGCQWAMLVIFAQMINPEAVGKFALGLAVTAPVIQFSQLQLRGVQATDAKDTYAFGHYFALRLTTTFLALIIILGITLVGNYGLYTSLVILAVGFSKACESISDIMHGLMQRHECMDRIAWSRIVKGSLSVGVVWLVTYIRQDVLVGVLAIAVVGGVVMLIYDVPRAKQLFSLAGVQGLNRDGERTAFTPQFNGRRLGQLAWLAFPLGLVMLLMSLNTNMPRYFLEKFHGESELGIFAALTYLIVVGNTIVGAMGQAVTPRLANLYADGDISGYKSLLFRLVLGGISLGLVGVVIAQYAGEPILLLLYGSEYSKYAQVLTWLMGVGALTYAASFLGYGITAARCFKSQLPLFLVVTLIIGVAAYVTIPMHSMSGAVFSLAVGAIIQICGSVVIIVYALRTI